MKCSICGSENKDTKFCTSCGAKLYDEEVTPEVKAEEPVTAEEQDPVSDMFTDPAADIAETEASVNAAAEDLNNAAGEAFHTMSGMDSQESSSTDSDSTDSGSSNYYDAGYQGGASYTETYTEGGGNIGFSIASLICGILSMLCCMCGCMNLPLSIAAVVLGIITITKHYDGKGMAIAGLITGGLGLVLGVIMTGMWVSSGESQELMDEIMDM